MAEPLPARVDLTLWRGDTRVWTDVLERNTGTDLAPVWVPIDLTGCTVLSQIRDGRSPSSAVLATMTCEVDAPTSGEIVRTLTATASAALPELDEGESAWWDLQVERADGFVRTYLFGKVKILGDVSRDV